MKKKNINPALWAGLILAAAAGFASGSIQESGDGLEAFNHITKPQAKALIARALKTGDPKLLDYSGWVLSKGLGVDKNTLLGSKYFSRAADKGNNRGWSHLIVLADQADFIEQLKKAADGNDAEAQNVLGELNAHGWGMKTDYAQALSWYHKSADNGFITALRNIGMVYEMGYGVPHNYNEAVKWFKQAAPKNDAAAEEALGKAYQEGWGVTKNYATSLSHYKRALELGEADAQNDMGWLYQHGLGVVKNDQKARECYEKAAVEGNANAANNLGFMYHTGEGTDKDEKQALKWYLQGANCGNTDSRDSMGRINLENGLDPKVVVKKKGIIHFDYRKSDLSPSDLQYLRTLGEFLTWNKNIKVKIDGYCDIRGTDDFNKALSERRAATVQEFLLYHGAKNSLFDIQGHGRKSPVAPNDNEKNMAQNRRVEITVEGL